MTIKLAIVAGLALVQVGCFAGSQKEKKSNEIGVVIGHAATLFPDEGASDWRTFSDQVSQIRVLSEQELPPNPLVLANREGYIPRKIRFRVEQNLWVGTEVARQSQELDMTTLGWILKGAEKKQAVAPNAPRLEVGGVYIMPLVRHAKNRVGPLTPYSIVALAGDQIAEEDVRQRGQGKMAASLGKMSAKAIGDLMANTHLDPLAMKHQGLSPVERAKAVVLERSNRLP